MKWQDKYCVNDDLMDKQHKKLFEILNKLEEDMLKDCALNQLVQTLEELSDYAWVHFKAEEIILDELNIKNIVAHKEEHLKFKKKIMETTQNFINDKNLEQVSELHSFLVHWLQHHILKIDMMYKV